MSNRVVVTGLGVVAPNAIGLDAFTDALRAGKNGIRHFPELEGLNFSCQLGGKPTVDDGLRQSYLSKLELRHFNSDGILYGVIAGMDAIKDAGIEAADSADDPLWDLGIVFGTGTSGVEKFREAIYKLDDGKVRRLGSSTVAQTMASGVSAYLGGKLGAGNQVTTNSSACATGTEAVILAARMIRSGQAKQVLCGSCSDGGPYVWGGFDAMKVTTYKHNAEPERASRPMSAAASGFVPACGAGALVLESLESALDRGAKIYCEVAGGSVNSGGQRLGGTMTAPNSKAVQKCITQAMQDAGVQGGQIDYINGHLTATAKDPVEIENWTLALGRRGKAFPLINSLKGLIGHGLAASGSLESVATVIQLHQGFVAPNVNCEDLHPEIEAMVNRDRIPMHQVDLPGLNMAINASFGFGDVNACVIFKKI